MTYKQPLPENRRIDDAGVDLLHADDPVSRTVQGEAIADAYRSAFRNHPGGVAVITADAGAGPAGLTATSVVSLSVDPPLIGFSLSSQSSAAPTIAVADSVMIHLIDPDSLEVAQRFATSGIDRFADASQWHTLPTGEPIVHGVRRWMRAQVVERTTAGTATVIIAQVMEMPANLHEIDARGDDPGALVYHDRGWFVLTDNSRLESRSA
ncbi:flavin reductase family protein [Rhodococcus sp. NCIMB 12038]|uniref:flavin reductase family protein n=1 Tax=Rhodococcus sp. NCIMB 12038 TaxID=933800 RepID=UPI000B3BDFCE|nr:flavin reductase family protein [Rhodococcus sp. NCIMB 12038]OUS91367.1 hypothetical protein CA951_33480 [Rhodococcus sp. NCIMB 12038]